MKRVSRRAVRLRRQIEVKMSEDAAVYGTKYQISDEEKAAIDHLFTYHAPAGDQGERYATLRCEARYMAVLILQNCPNSRERVIAIERLKEALFWANASIAVNE